MNGISLFGTALKNLRRAKLRSSLTTLGISVGVAAVVSVVSIGDGARSYVERTLADIELNQLQITADPQPGRWRPGFRWGLAPGDGLTLDDYQAIRQDTPGIAAATVRAFGTLRSPASVTDQLRINAQGVDVQGFAVLGRRIVVGSTFSIADIKKASRVSVITEFLAHARFGNENPIGNTIRISDHLFLVVGVMQDNQSFRDRGPNDPGDITAYVPYTTFLRRLDRTAKIAIILRAEDPAQLARIQRDVSNQLERRRGKRVAQFTTGNVTEIVNRQLESSRTLALLLGSIGIVSLLVGGIGVMNVMLVSVGERIREVGIRMAVGTRHRTVMHLFLIEAMLLCLLGGAAGVIAGIATTHLIAYVSEWPVRITLPTIFFALVCSAALGLFFGYYPAKRAANLDPIQALRAE